MTTTNKKFEQSYFEGLTPNSVQNAVIKETVKDILELAKTSLSKPIAEMRVLDVGSGWGNYSLELGKHVREVVGVEPYRRLYLQAIKNKKNTNTKFYNELIENVKSEKKFDLVISLTTIEHMPNVQKSFKRIYELMNKESLLYVTAPNKLWPVEPHYRLLFLSYLPLPLANLYLKLTKRGESFKDSSYALTYSQIKNLFNKFKWKYSFILPNPDAVYLGCGEDGGFNKTIKRIGIKLINVFPFMWTISKGFIIVAKKNINE